MGGNRGLCSRRAVGTLFYRPFIPAMAGYLCHAPTGLAAHSFHSLRNLNYFHITNHLLHKLQFENLKSILGKRGGCITRARVLYARMTVRCLHHLHHFYKIRRPPSKIWRSLFLTGGREIFTGGLHAKYMNHHFDVVQVVQAPNTHTREITRARETITIVQKARGKRKTSFPFAFLSFFRNFGTSCLTYLALRRKNKRVCFVLLSFFRNFAP